MADADALRAFFRKEVGVRVPLPGSIIYAPVLELVYRTDLKSVITLESD